MPESAKAIRERIDRLAGDISAGRISSTDCWSGADIVISPTPPDLADPADPAAPPEFSDPADVDNFDETGEAQNFHPDKRYVVTAFAGELSWLFVAVRDAFGTAVDFRNKYHFYARLADAADHYLTGESKEPNEPQTLKGLLEAVLVVARAMADEVR